MAYDDNRDPIEGTYRHTAGARGRECGAGELRGLLQRIADHIANADQRQQSAFDEMQSRLDRLAQKWPGQSHASDPEGPGLWPDPMHNSPRSGRPAYQSQRQQPLHPSRSIAEAPPPLRSAANQSTHVWDRSAAPTHSAAERAFHPTPPRSQPEQQHGEWDRVSAEALTRLYEPDHGTDFNDISSSPAAAEAGRFDRGFGGERDDRSRSRSQLPSGHFETAPGQRHPETDRLELRLADIAARVEQALAELDPKSSIGALEARLERFEERIGSTLADLASRAGVEELRALEGFIEELARHVERAHSRLARLDEIELNLARLVEQTSDGHVAQLLDQQVLSEPRIARLAEAVAEHLRERDASRGEVGAGIDRLRELHGLIEQFVSTQRQGDQQTAAALEVIQEAVLNLLDRMETLEQSYHPGRSGSDADFGESWRPAHRSDGAPSEPSYRYEDSDRFTAGMVSITERPRVLAPLETSQISRSGSIGAESQLDSPIAKGELPEQFPQAPSEGARRESASPSIDSPAEASPIHKSREDFLAAARRAARKASSEAAEGVGAENSARRRSAAGGTRASGAPRPVTGLVVAMLAVVLAVGVGVTTYSVYKDRLSETWKAGRSVWELGRGAGSAGEGSAAGGAAGSEGTQPSAGTNSGPSATTPGVIIDDPQGSHPSEAEDGSGGTRTVTGLPGGIIIDTSTIAAAARAGEAPVPAALTSGDSEALKSPAARSPKTGSAKGLMPPASVGPLSLRLAAANGDPSAEFEVAVRLDEGRGVPRDIDEAVIWYQRSAARGFAPAQYRLGTLYERGLGVTADRGRAMAWYKSAAEKGNVKAMHNFAVLSASGDPVDFRTAAHWFSEAATRGLVDSQYNLAVLYETGRGVTRDLKQAYKWFALAARGGDKEAVRRRDRVKWMLNATELKAAEALVRSWKPEPTEPLVNNARAAGEAWKRRDGQG